MVTEEARIEEMRRSRNDLLKDSDWTQLPDVPLSVQEKAEWAVYRQALRDVPQQEGFPYAPLPEVPGQM